MSPTSRVVSDSSLGTPGDPGLRHQIRRQRNRIHFEPAVPSDLVQMRVATAVAAGGRLLELDDRWRVAYPEAQQLGIASRA